MGRQCNWRWHGPDIWVNSFHHQAVAELPDNFKVSARASDGTIEAIESTGDSFCFGAQWHPEATYKNDRMYRAIFKNSFPQLTIIRYLVSVNSCCGDHYIPTSAVLISSISALPLFPSSWVLSFFCRGFGQHRKKS